MTGNHYLVTTARPWSEAPTVLGIFDSAEEAHAAIARAQTDVPGPDRYAVELWRGQRQEEVATEGNRWIAAQ